MEQQIVITNRNSTPTTLLVEGSNTPIAGSGSITIGAVAMMHLLQDPVQRLRFLSAGDLTRTAFAPSGGPAQSFSATVDATALGTTQLVPGISGYRWLTTRTNFSVAASSGSPTSAQVAVRSAGAVVQGINVDGTLVPLTSFAGLQTAPGAGLDVTVDTAATAGALSVQVVVEGKYSV